MADRLFGMEAELAVSGRSGVSVLPPALLAGRLVDVARRTLTALCGTSTRLYLGNGGVFYIDAGNHPEYATPECVTPGEVVSHLRAGERLVERLVRQAGEEMKADEMQLSRTNVDYQCVTTWGCHESYLGQRPVEAYADWLVPHLASRLVFTGSGGLDPRSPGIRFSLSPRVAFIHHVATNDSTSQRGIFHLRDEPLCSGHSRIHVLAGDNACSQRATWLKVGTTALVVALADASRRRLDWVKLVDPVAAMSGFARDRGYRGRVLLRGGVESTMTAVELQRHLLARVESAAGAAAMPAWAGEVCRAWRQALDLAESAEVEQSHVFDWSLKFALFRREIALRDFTLEAVAVWTDTLERVLSPKAATGAAVLSPALVDTARLQALRTRGLLSGDAFDQADRLLRQHGLLWEGLDAFVALRRQLCATDLRFGEMSTGIFDSLDRQGLLPDQRVVSDAQIEAATREPPARTRAVARAHWIRKLARADGRYLCDWNGIYGKDARLVLDDPFDTNGRWVPERQGPGLPGAISMLPPF